MTIAEEIKVLCARLNISTAELARRTGQSPQNFSSKLKRGSFTIEDLEEASSFLPILRHTEKARRLEKVLND